MAGKPKGGLTAKQKVFVEEFLKDLNQTQAAIRAGYSKRSAKDMGCQLMENGEIREAIDAALKARSQRTEITVDYVLENLTEVVERCMQRAPVMVRRGQQMVQLVDEEGRNVWRFDANGTNKALELLGKHLGMFTEKIALVDEDRPLEEMSDAELLKKLRGNGK